MALDSRHPLYSQMLDQWTQMRDTYKNERAVKDKDFLYLPATAGMIEDGAKNRSGKGWESYKAYRTRARVPAWVKEAVKSLVGVMHNKPPIIELPPLMESMRDAATSRGESLEAVLRRINEEQLITGRVGLFGDVADEGLRAGQPYISVYVAEDMINWDEGSRTGIEIQNLNLVVLNESENKRLRDFEWEFVESYRVLVLGDPMTNEPQGSGTYMAAVFEDDVTFSPEELFEPRIGANVLVGELPFVFVNSQDLVAEPDEPPLMGLSDLVLTIYRSEADYRQSLFMQGQDTLVTIGTAEDGEPLRVGSDGRINITNTEGDAKYIGVDSSGLAEQRMALENDRSEAAQMSGQLLDSASRERESGDALRIRQAGRTATLTRVALAGAGGLQEILRKIARWMGLDPKQVVVTPNLDFIDDTMGGKDLVELMTAKTLGAPMSLQTVHQLMQRRNVTELTWEEEIKELESEQSVPVFSEDSGGSTAEDGPEDDVDPEGEPRQGEGEPDPEDE